MEASRANSQLSVCLFPLPDWRCFSNCPVNEQPGSLSEDMEQSPVDPGWTWWAYYLSPPLDLELFGKCRE